MSRKLLNEKEIFKVACCIESADARDSYVDHICGDDSELQGRVATLLQMHDEEPEFLEAPVAATAGLPPVAEVPGTRIGPYKIREQIGEGGMGVVYVAEQTEPVRRKVALKIIKPGMDTRQVVARFEAERQALALMDHPNIAKVLDAGATDAGRPYFVMDLVSGTPITKYCDQARVSTTERLGLFIEVCKAIQHAHQKGIIHRDIKPSNVLITMMEDGPAPKVIDFGIAKAVDQQLTEQTLYTAHDEMIGTPLYMSPEQAEMVGFDVDTRSDVYSLGVLLYTLLTGQTPFDKETMKQAGFDEIRRIIREDEPQRPSARIGTLSADQLSTISDRRGVDPRKYSHTLSGELDWIVMRALEKDRTRRYDSASAFAADIQRYLGDEPVEACPPSTAYRLQKFARRNTVTLFTTALVAASLLIGTGVSIWQARRANAEARNAAANLILAITAVDEMYTEVAETSLRTSPRSQGFRRDVLEKALKFYLGFAKNNSDPNLDYETAMAWRRVGETYHRLEQNSKSKGALLTAIECLKSLVAQSPDQPRYRRKLADTYRFLSKPMEVSRQFRQGEVYCRMAIEMQTQLVKEYPDESEYRAALAVTQHQLGHMLRHADEATAAFTVSSELLKELNEETPQNMVYVKQLAHNYSHLGRLLYDVGKTEEAHETYRASVQLIGEPGSPADADVVDTHHAILGGTYRNWGVLLRDTERLQKAETAHRNAVRLFGELVQDFPSVIYYHKEMGLSQLELGRTLAAAGRHAEAKEAFEAAHHVFSELDKSFPDNPVYERGQERAQELLGIRVETTEPEGIQPGKDNRP